MALVTFSALVSNMIGKLGGGVFQGSSSGTVLHNATRNTNGSRQNIFRQQSNVASLQAAWQALAPADRQLWEVYASFRHRPTRKSAGKFLTGQATFILENSIRLIFNAAGGALAPAILVSPIITTPPGQIAFINITNTAGVLSYNTDQTFNPAENFFMIYISRPLLGSQMSGYNKQKLICKPLAAGNYQTITSEYTTLWAVIPNTGQYVNVEIFLYSILTNTFGSSTKQRIQIS